MHHREGEGDEERERYLCVYHVMCSSSCVCVCVYHNLSKWTHLHDVLELLIHVSEGELACKER